VAAWYRACASHTNRKSHLRAREQQQQQQLLLLALLSLHRHKHVVLVSHRTTFLQPHLAHSRISLLLLPLQPAKQIT
jgi:hypothetical protein